ncbi:hypothetical protein PGIGA_G00018540 [Pangasianodon gigas]|uniref:Uncharacterized protein n=1 Tax=Pangasianodon gigas TaxID=30993 RepID=A0ACC5WUN9_PANGG|nr:hypothetical protein [Pangasianodon gigas]
MAAGVRAPERERLRGVGISSDLSALCAREPAAPCLHSSRPNGAARHGPRGRAQWHESYKSSEVFPEKRRERDGAKPRSVSEQDPRGRSSQPAVQHERLLLQAEGAGAQHPAEQAREQNGDPAACHRLHPGSADRPRLPLRDEHSPSPPTRPGLVQNTSHHHQHRHQDPVLTDAGLSVRLDHRGQSDTLPLKRCLLKT